MGGYIMQLQNFSVNDGEGIRTVIFMAGCPLRCRWCSNPEGQTPENPLTHWAETADIAAQIHRQAIFYRRSGGGVTFSGGEATAQAPFLAELTDVFYDDGFDLALETCGHFAFAQLEPTLRKMNLIFMDFKHSDPEIHRRFTGVDNRLILENICRTAQLKIPMVIRIPAILGVNCDEANLRASFAFLAEHAPRAGVEFLPYHRYGEGKYRQLGLALPDAAFGTPTEEQLAGYEALACQYKLHVVSYR